MDRLQMDELIDTHIKAEMAGDIPASVAVYTDDVVHDVVGSPTGPVTGKDAASGFYEYLTSTLDTEAMVPTRSYYGDDFCVVEHDATAVINGEFMGIPGQGKRVTFRLLHIWEFGDGKISRENVWMDGGAIAAQLAGAAS